MLTLREAIQRLSMNKMRIMRQPHGGYRIVFHEDKTYDEYNSYVTDDLEDAILTGARMRKKRLQAI